LRQGDDVDGTVPFEVGRDVSYMDDLVVATARCGSSRSGWRPAASKVLEA
jgi:hypothetical protein